MNIYSAVTNAIHAQITAHLIAENQIIDVHKIPYQDLAHFPAVSIELKSRRKAKKGLGVSELTIGYEIWVYTNVLDEVEAQDQCAEVAELVEVALESDKTLGGVVHYLSIDNELEFGVIQQGSDFLQGARMTLEVTKRVA